MDIAAMSTAMSRSSLSSEVGIRLLAMANKQAEQEGQMLLKLMEKSIDPNLGKTLDIKA